MIPWRTGPLGQVSAAARGREEGKDGRLWHLMSENFNGLVHNTMGGAPGDLCQVECGGPPWARYTHRAMVT
jgi:hypothetical protein